VTVEFEATDAGALIATFTASRGLGVDGELAVGITPKFVVWIPHDESIST